MDDAPELLNDRVYDVNKLKEVLEYHGLPSSLQWVYEQERRGLIPDPRTSVGRGHPRRYTGKAIKAIINSYLERIDGKVQG